MAHAFPRAKAPAAPASTGLAPTTQLATLRAWLAFAERAYADAGLALGQVAATAHDEALFLLLRLLDWPLDSDESVLDRRLDPAQRIRLRQGLERRVRDRVPAAYIVGEAWLGGLRFQIDERVIIPRSYFVEHLQSGQLDLLIGAASAVRRVVDVCTGSGCLAILLAKHFPRAQVDAIDLSPDALAVAAVNVRAHGLSRRVRLHQSDVFASVPAPAGGYDLILSNPPYEPSAVCDRLPEEFRREPRLALDGGRDGLDIIRRLLREATPRLAPRGIVAIEVGGLQAAMEQEFGHLDLLWLPSEDGSDCVCVVRADRLRAAAAATATAPRTIRARGRRRKA
jgi:ribosomal protein L3 glutamine methyltransferase